MVERKIAHPVVRPEFSATFAKSQVAGTRERSVVTTFDSSKRSAE